MHVEIDDGDPFEATPLQDANRYGDVVEGTEPFAVVCEGVVEPAADVSRCTEV